MNQNSVINVIIYDQYRLFRTSEQILNEFVGIKYLTIEEDALFWFQITSFHCIKNSFYFFIGFNKLYFKVVNSME